MTSKQPFPNSTSSKSAKGSKSSKSDRASATSSSTASSSPFAASTAWRFNPEQRSTTDPSLSSSAPTPTPTPTSPSRPTLQTRAVTTEASRLLSLPEIARSSSSPSSGKGSGSPRRGEHGRSVSSTAYPGSTGKKDRYDWGDDKYDKYDKYDYEDDYGDDYDDRDDRANERKTAAKRLSGHANVYTECGRHGDEWLFRNLSITNAVKRVMHPHQDRREGAAKPREDNQQRKKK